MILFNIGWMKRYAGTHTDDRTFGWHGYLRGAEAPLHGHEAFNFLSLPDGKVRGYAPVGHNRGVNLAKLGGRQLADHVDGVLVVWFARNPEDKQAYVVGWYCNARVFRRPFDPTNSLGWAVHGDPVWHIAETDTKDAIILPPDERTLPVPSRNVMDGGFGQSCIWYADKLPQFRRQLLRFIARHERNRSTTPPLNPPKNPDPHSRLDVETEAMEAGKAYITSQGLKWADVSKFAKGWDLEGHSGDRVEFLVEVKGLSGTAIAVELTPNEFDKMGKNRDRYVVFIRTGCLTGAGANHVFRYDRIHDTWRDDQGRTLAIQEATSAILRLA
ncbi:MAG TPA: DUF3883 domain-containing protein [Azospirillaceae bacterium]|nr:DUF3883 domain-containing protein [Azospirillaceae bacterium]